MLTCKVIRLILFFIILTSMRFGGGKRGVGGEEEELGKQRECCNRNRNGQQMDQTSSQQFKSTNGVHDDIPLSQEQVSWSFAIVTALIDLGRETWPSFKRRLGSYMGYSQPLLAMNIPIIAFVDHKVAPFVRHLRRGKENMTQIHEITVEDLEYYKYYRQISHVMQSEIFKKDNHLLNHPEGFSPEYNILMNSKFALLYETSKANAFNASYYYWLDMGYGHGQNVYPKDAKWEPSNIMDTSDKITYINLNNITLVQSLFQIYKQKIGPSLSGGFFGGSKRAIEKYYYLHQEVFLDFLKAYMMDDDQTVALACWMRQPELFNLVYAGWYDAFKMFH